jgi:hypothetical protein
VVGGFVESGTANLLEVGTAGQVVRRHVLHRATAEEAVRARAAEEGKTIGEYLLELIRKDLRKPSRAAWLAEAKSLPRLSVTASSVRASLEEDRDGGQR